MPAGAAAGAGSFDDAAVAELAKDLADVFVADAGRRSFESGEGEGVADVRADECPHELGFGAAAACHRLGMRLELAVGRCEDAEGVGEPGPQVVPAFVPADGGARECVVVGLFALLDQLLDADEAADLVATLGEEQQREQARNGWMTRKSSV